MEKIITHPVNERHGLRSRRWQLLAVVMLFFVFCSFYVKGQISWNNNPTVTPNQITVLSDPSILDISFTPMSEIPGAKALITLPANIKYEGINEGTTHNSGITYTVAATGQVITISFTSNGNKLLVNQQVDLRLKVGALKGAENGLVKVEVQGSSAVTGGVKEANYIVQTPTIRLTSNQPTINFTGVGDVKPFTLKLDAINGEAKSCKITFKHDQYTLLENFEIDGRSITAETAGSGNNKEVILKLTATELEGKLGTTPKIITFNASASRMGSRTIRSSVQYSNETNVSIQDGVVLTMVLPSDPGKPNMSIISSGFIKSLTDETGINGFSIPMDGVTTNYYRVGYQNTGSSDAYDVTYQLNLYRDAAGSYNYFDIENIYYSIDGGAKEKIDPTTISILSKLPNSNRRILKPGMNEKANIIRFVVPETLSKGSRIYFYCATAGGDIYDNSNSKVSTIEAGLYTAINWYNYNIWANNGNGEAGGRPTNTYGAGGYAYPRIHSGATLDVLRPGESGEGSFSLESGDNRYGDQSIDIYAKLPAWLELDGATIEDAFQFGNVTPVSSQDHGNNIYSIRIANTVTRQPLKLKYKASSTCPAPIDENKNDSIRYWVNWNTGAAGNSLNRPTLEYFTQVYQPVTLLCKEEGIVLDDFSLRRTTKGLKDYGNNGIPDDDTVAEDTEINHNIYLRGDEGQMELAMHVVGAPGSTYPYLYVLMSSDANLQNAIPLGKGKLQIGGGSQTEVDCIQVSSTQYYLKYSGSFNAGDNISLIVPFTARNHYNTLKTIVAECYVSNTDLSGATVFNPAVGTRFGEDKDGQSITIYNESLGRDRSAATFTDNVPVSNFAFSYFDTYHNNGFPAPYFEKEIRPIILPERFELELPEGYIINDDFKIKASSRDLSNNREISLPIAGSVLNSNGTTTYTYDLSSIYVNSTEASPDANYPVNKWIYPDERVYYAFNATVQATKAAIPASNIKSEVFFYNNLSKANSSSIHSFPVNYTGIGCSLNTSVNSVTVYDPNGVQIPSITIGNPNTFDMQDTWIYIDGNVSDLVLNPIAGGASISGTGNEGRWLKIEGVVPAGKSQSYSLDFKHTNTTNAGNDTIRVYMASGFNSSWSPNTSVALNLTDYEHFGGSSMLTLLPGLSKVNGALIVSDPALVHNQSYTLSASLDSKSSEGALRDPQMVITVPAGQEYIANSATIEYPIGTISAIPSAIETVLAGLNSDLTLDRTVTFNLAEAVGNTTVLLPGFRAANVDERDQKAILSATFSPQCETMLTGIRYTGILSGKTAVGATAEGSNRTTASTMLLPTLNTNYGFNVNASLAGADKAFGELKTTGELVVKMTKVGGASTNLPSTDRVMIELPAALNVTGAIVQSSIITGVSGEITPMQNVVNGQVRTIYLPLPNGAYNADAQKGMGKEVQFTIPVVYDPAVAVDQVNNPEKTIDVKVTSIAQFGTCEATEAAIGSNSVKTALVTLNNNPTKAFVGEAANLQVTSVDFGGKWYGADKTTELSSSATYAYTPQVSELGPQTFYVSVVFNGENYGFVPVNVAVYPSLNYSFASTLISCGSTIPWAAIQELAAGYDQANGTVVKFYQTNNSGVLSNEITSDHTAVDGQTIYAQSSNAGGKGEIKNCVLTVNTPVTLTTDLNAAVTINHDQTFTLSVAVDPSSTGPLTYKWFKNGLQITTPNSATYSKANATTADNGTYHVEVTGACGESGKAISTSCVVTVNPSLDYTLTQPATKCAPATFTMAELNALVTGVASGVNVKFYHNNTPSNEITSTITVTDGQNIYVQTSGAAGAGTIGVITFTVNTPISITTDLATSLFINDGVNQTLSITASGTIDSYQWYKDGVAISGATSSSYTIATANNATHSGDYYVEVNGPCGTVASTTMALTVYPSLALTIAPSDPICNGNPTSDIDLATLVTSAGYPALLSGVTLEFNVQGNPSLLSNTIVQPSATTVYEVRAKNAGGTSGATYEITLTVEQQTMIFSQPQSTVVDRGSRTQFSVSALGESLSYQWQKRNPSTGQFENVASNGTSSVYEILSTSSSDEGFYQVVVTGVGTCGATIISNTVVLTVLTGGVTPTAPVITEGLSGTTLCPDDSYTLSVTATGTSLTYQWYLNSQPIAGATGANYAISSMEASKSGRYEVEVSNAQGRVSSFTTVTMKGIVPSSIAISDIPNLPKTGVAYRISATYVEGAVYTWSFSDGPITVTPTSEPNVFDITFSQIGRGRLSVTVDTGCGGAGSSGSTSSGDIDVIQSETGIDDIKVTSLQVYPNPVETELYIKSANSVIRKVKITTMGGAQVYAQQGLNVNELTLDASNWAQTITYLVIIETDKGTTVHKIIKK